MYVYLSPKILFFFFCVWYYDLQRFITHTHIYIYIYIYDDLLIKQGQWQNPHPMANLATRFSFFNAVDWLLFPIRACLRGSSVINLCGSYNRHNFVMILFGRRTGIQVHIYSCFLDNYKFAYIVHELLIQHENNPIKGGKKTLSY